MTRDDIGRALAVAEAKIQEVRAALSAQPGPPAAEPDEVEWLTTDFDGEPIRKGPPAASESGREDADDALARDYAVVYAEEMADQWGKALNGEPADPKLAAAFRRLAARLRVKGEDT